MKKHILVIDDQEAVRDAFVLSLEDSGYEVEVAASGENGLQKLSEKACDLIFLDLKMPGMNGVETLREIRQRCPHVSVCVVTAFCRDYLDLLQEARDEGLSFELLRKPVELEEIRLLTRGLLEGPVPL